MLLDFPYDLLNELDREFELFNAQRDRDIANRRIWRFSRTTAWSYVKVVMECAFAERMWVIREFTRPDSDCSLA